MASFKDHERVIKLRKVIFGKRIIRYMVYVTNKNNREYSKPPDKLLLFLGTDVLSNCGSSDAKNLGRVHSKYSEEGLACKVYLPNGYQIKGIRGVADKAWFYSIHGLFRVAFSFYPRNELKVLLKEMLSLWMARAEDPLLQKTLVIDDTQDICHENLISESTADCDKSHCCKEAVNDLNWKSQHSEPMGGTGDNVDRGIQCVIGLELNECIDQKHRVPDYQMDPKECKNERVVPRCTDAQSNKSDGHCIAHIFETTTPRLLQVYKDEPGCSLIAPYIKSFADLLIDEKKNIFEQQSTSFPIKLIKDYMDAKYNKMSEAPQDHELAIHIVSSWVGDRFYLFKDIIRHNIDSFKQTYINSISELPSPEEIVRTVYPSAMYSLIYLWIRGTGEDGQDDVQEAKRIRSICLLILELLNGSPITGLGHWIFSVI